MTSPATSPLPPLGLEEEVFTFTLTHVGSLPAHNANRDFAKREKRAVLKNSIREDFHHQLERYWQMHPRLKRIDLERLPTAEIKGKQRGAGRRTTHLQPGSHRFGRVSWAATAFRPS